MTSHPLPTLLLAALLAATTLASYAPVFSADFAAIDDHGWVADNEMVRAGLGREGFAWAFGSNLGNWVPLTWLSHMLDVELFGLDPGRHHAVNVALHAANAALLFAMLAWITGALTPSFVCAAWFALHPANVESVAWIAQRKTVLSSLFAILAIWSYARYARAGGRGFYAGSLASFALSLMAKQTMVTLPFALLLLDAWPLRRDFAREWRRLLLEKLPYGVLAAAASVATVVAQEEAIATGSMFPLAVRIGNAVISYVRYLGLFLWPNDLAVFRPLFAEDVTLPVVVACAALLLAITAVVLVLARERRHLLVGWLWFLGTLVPTIGVLQVGAQSMADRYAYLPFLGLQLAFTWSAWEIWQARRTGPALRAVLGAAVVAGSVVLGVLTHRQAGNWQDSITLFESAVANTEGNYLAHRALAGQYFGRGDYARALVHAEAGSRHPYDLARFLPIHGLALYLEGSKAQGIAKLEEAVRAEPDNVLAYSNLGWVYLQEGEPERARDLLARAATLAPERIETQLLLVASQLRLGELVEAAERLARVNALAPLHFDAWFDRVRTLERLGRLEEAAAVLQDALVAAAGFEEDRRPQLISTLRQRRGELLAALGDPAAALEEQERALAVWPDNHEANASLSWLLATSADPELRDPTRAVALAERACALSARRDPHALSALAAAYHAVGRRDDAARAAREATDRARGLGDAAALAALEARLRPYAGTDSSPHGGRSGATGDP